MELETFQTIVTFLSLFISITSLVITLAVVWGHKETVVITEATPVIDAANEALEQKIADMNYRLFNKG
jgi:hypothetical protein